MPPFRNDTREHGSVIFYILIAIVALAALVMAVSRSSRESVSTVGREKADLAATEIFDYINAVRGSVQNMKIQGVQDNQLCFDNPSWGNADFVYAACSTEKNKVFSNSGGNAPVQHNVNLSLIDRSYEVSIPLSGTWYYTGTIRVREVGQDCDPSSDCNELVAVLIALKKDVCVSLNKKLGITDPENVPDNPTPISLAPYVGVYTYDADSVINAPGLVGKRTGCFKDSSGPYIFYAVLSAN